MEKSWEVFLFFLRFPGNPSRNSTLFWAKLRFREKKTHHPRKRIENSTPNPCAPLLPGGHLFQGNATQASWAIFRGIGGGMPKNCIDSGWIFPTRKWVVESNDPPVLEKKKRRSTWLSRQNVGPWLRENVGPSLAPKTWTKTGRPKGNPTWLIGLHIRPSFRGEGEGTLGGGLVELISHKKRFFSIHGGKKTKNRIYTCQFCWWSFWNG